MLFSIIVVVFNIIAVLVISRKTAVQDRGQAEMTRYHVRGHVTLDFISLVSRESRNCGPTWSSKIYIDGIQMELVLKYR